MKKILFKSLLFAGAVFMTACNDGMTDFLNDYKTILYFTNSGEAPTTIYRTGEDNICPIAVYKAGSDEKATTSATVALMTNEEIASYNVENGTDYMMLPDNCFSVDPSALTLSFGADDQYKTIDLKINPIAFEAVPDRSTKKYIIGLRLISSPDSINATKDIILVKPSLEDAKISFGKAGYTANSVQVNGTGDVTLTLPINLSMKSTWEDLKIELEVDPTLLSGTSYTELPADAYQFPTEVLFKKGTKSASVDITVKREKLSFGTFVIPIKIASVSKDFFKTEAATSKCLMGVTKFPGQISLAAEMLSAPDGFIASGDGGGLAALVDGNVDTYMHSAYSPKPMGNSKYGIYFDITLEKPLTMLSFGFTTRKTNGNGAPKRVKIYVSNDNTTWTELASVTSGMPTAANTAYTSEVYSSTATFKYVRFSCLESAGGTMDVDGGEAGFYSLSEFSLYGL